MEFPKKTDSEAEDDDEEVANDTVIRDRAAKLSKQTTNGKNEVVQDESVCQSRCGKKVQLDRTQSQTPMDTRSSIETRVPLPVDTWRMADVLSGNSFTTSGSGSAGSTDTGKRNTMLLTALLGSMKRIEERLTQQQQNQDQHQRCTESDGMNPTEVVVEEETSGDVSETSQNEIL